jgi:galactan endo-beta-1,3-galactanase
MKNLKNILTFLFMLSILASCQKEEVSNSSDKSGGFEPNKLKYSLVTLVPTNSFSSLTSYWNYNYPWGTDHNGSARMRSSQVTTSGSVLTCTAVPGTASDKASIHYYSGTIWCKTQVTVSNSWPLWRVSGQFQCPSAKGTWPAFWLNNADGWPPESDIMEFKGSATCWTNTYKNLSGAWSSVGTSVSSPASWHTYTAWIARYSATDVKIEYWIDGVKVSTQYGQNFMNDPLNLIIDLQMEGSSGTPGPSGTTVMKGQNVTIQRSATL